MNVKYTVDESINKQLMLFKEALLENGYAPQTATGYVNTAREYLSTGRPLTKEAIDEYYRNRLQNENLTATQRNGISSRKMGIVRFRDLFYGDASKLKRYSGKRPSQWKKKECDKDCLNCKYPDCIFD